MVTIIADTDMMSQAATRMQQQAQELESTLGQLSSAAERLNYWEGASYYQFTDLWQQASGQLRTLAQQGQHLGSHLQATATAFEQTDEQQAGWSGGSGDVLGASTTAYGQPMIKDTYIRASTQDEIDSLKAWDRWQLLQEHLGELNWVALGFGLSVGEKLGLAEFLDSYLQIYHIPPVADEGLAGLDIIDEMGKQGNFDVGAALNKFTERHLQDEYTGGYSSIATSSGELANVIGEIANDYATLLGLETGYIMRHI